MSYSSNSRTSRNVSSARNSFCDIFLYSAARLALRAKSLYERTIVLARLKLQRGSKSREPRHGAYRRATLTRAARWMAALAETGHAVRHYAHGLTGEASACRECGRPAKLSWKTCEHCGAGNPVRINISASVLITGVGSELSIVLFQLI